MKTEDLGNSRIVGLIFKPAGMLMGSRARRWLMNPVKTLKIAGIQPGQSVLEVGCGTGFFTIPAGQMIGDKGRLIALDASADFVKTTTQKVRQASLNNVRVVQRDALETGVEAASVDKVILFGVLPFPLLPLDKLLPEMHRVMKPGGTMAVWLFPPLVHFWVPKSICRSGLFKPVDSRSNVYNFVKH